MYLKSDTKCLFLRQLALMLKSGKSLSESLNAILDAGDSSGVHRLVKKITRDKAAGVPMEEALGRHANVFTPSLIHAIAKDKGSVDAAPLLNTFADAAEDEAELKAKLFKAIYYPMITLVIACLVSLLLLFFVIPIWQDMFESFGANLPTPTHLVFAANPYLQIIAVVLILLTAIGIGPFTFNKRFFYSVANRFPGMPNILRKASVAVFARQMSVFLEAAMPVGNAISLAVSSLGNPRHQRRLENELAGTQTLVQLREAVSKSTIFPALMGQVLATGQNPSDISRMLLEAAAYYRRDMDRSILKFVALAEVTAILLVGLLVGSLVIAMYLPLFKMAGVIS